MYVLLWRIVEMHITCGASLSKAPCLNGVAPKCTWLARVNDDFEGHFCVPATASGCFGSSSDSAPKDGTTSKYVKSCLDLQSTQKDGLYPTLKGMWATLLGTLEVQVRVTRVTVCWGRPRRLCCEEFQWPRV